MIAWPPFQPSLLAPFSTVVDTEIKRRADVVQVFPNRDSVTRLIGSVLLEQHEEWQYGERRYLSDISMRRLAHTLHQDHQPTAITA